MVNLVGLGRGRVVSAQETFLADISGNGALKGRCRSSVVSAMGSPFTHTHNYTRTNTHTQTDIDTVLNTRTLINAFSHFISTLSHCFTHCFSRFLSLSPPLSFSFQDTPLRFKMLHTQGSRAIVIVCGRPLAKICRHTHCQFFTIFNMEPAITQFLESSGLAQM